MLQKRGAATEAMLQRIRSVPPDDIATTIVTFQEEVQGWLAAIHRAKTAADILSQHHRLSSVRVDFERMNVLPFDAAAQATFENLRPQCRRVGTLDIRIASIALATDSVLLTRNSVDFERVPDLRFEDWTVP